jgi:hypothetical protein
MKKGRLPSLFLLSTEPISGIWFEANSFNNANRLNKFTYKDQNLIWMPYKPIDAEKKNGFIEKLNYLVKDYKLKGEISFLKLSGTTKTGITWSLPAVGSCPQIDETCKGCYALDGFYRTNIAAQVGRVLRHEYLKNLIKNKNLDEWIGWISKKINNLSVVEKIPSLNKIDKKLQESSPDLGEKIFKYFRWHDSGDIFHYDYAIAILEVCRLTPSTLHWLPTRLGALIKKIVQDGEILPANLAIQISCFKNGIYEQQQINNVLEIKKIQPDARVGITYAHQGKKNREIDKEDFNKNYNPKSYICPATVAKKSEDRVCNGCRKCWSFTSIENPVIYAVHKAN